MPRSPSKSPRPPLRCSIACIANLRARSSHFSVARAPVQLQERPAVPRGPVAEPAAFSSGPALPRQLAGRDQDRVELAVRRGPAARRRSPARRGTTARAARRLVPDFGRPVEELRSRQGRARKGLDHAVHELGLVLLALERRGLQQREDVAGEAVSHPEGLPDSAVGHVPRPDARAQLRVDVHVDQSRWIASRATSSRPSSLAPTSAPAAPYRSLIQSLAIASGAAERKRSASRGRGRCRARRRRSRGRRRGRSASRRLGRAGAARTASPAVPS